MQATIISTQEFDATGPTVSECKLCKRYRDDLEVAMVTQPAIRKAFEEERRKRSEML